MANEVHHEPCEGNEKLFCVMAICRGPPQAKSKYGRALTLNCAAQKRTHLVQYLNIAESCSETTINSIRIGCGLGKLCLTLQAVSHKHFSESFLVRPSQNRANRNLFSPFFCAVQRMATHSARFKVLLGLNVICHHCPQRSRVSLQVMLVFSKQQRLETADESMWS